MDQCPNCGYKIGGQANANNRLRMVKWAYAGYKRRRITRFENNVDDALSPWKPPPQIPGGPGAYFEASRKRPARAMNVESDFITPLFQALGLAVFIFLSLYLGGVVFQVQILRSVACFGGLVAAGGFYLLVLVANRRLLWIDERVINDDNIDGDGDDDNEPPSAPPSPRPPLEVLHKNEAGKLKTIHRLNLPDSITDQKLVEFAQGAPLKGLSQGVWTGGAGSFSRSEFDALMAELERAGIVAWVNPENRSQGRKLTQAGRAALRYWGKNSRERTREQAPGPLIGRFEHIE